MKEKNRVVLFIVTISMLFTYVQCRDFRLNIIAVYSSSLDGDRLTKKDNMQFGPDSESSLPAILIDANTHVSKH